jgi:PAS domain S-box-containing protein
MSRGGCSVWRAAWVGETLDKSSRVATTCPAFPWPRQVGYIRGMFFGRHSTLPRMQVHTGDDAAKFAGLLDSAMDAIISVNEAHQVVLFNRAAEGIFGRKAAEVLGQPLELLIPDRFHAAHAEHVKRFGRMGVSSRHMGGSVVVYGRRANGEEFPVDASISQLDTAEGKLFTVILRDVTAKMRAEHENARLIARLSGLLDSAMDAIITIDHAQHIVLYNRAAERVFGWPAGDVMGQPLDKLLPARFRGSHAGHVRQFETTGTSSRRMGDGLVLCGQRANGEEFPLEASISQLDTDEGKLLTVILRDITQKVRAQEELSRFAAEAHATLENEKTRVARELHDELAQSLTALKMDAIWVRDNLPDDGNGATTKLSEMLSMIDTTVAATRRIAADLRPLMLDDLGLIPAVDWLVRSFTERSGVPCALSVDEEMELHEPYATAAFRILQEALANVGKHAQASRATVAIDRTADVIVLKVTDNGRGFSLAEPRKPESLGLMGLRERVRLLKGTIDIDSEPGRGTQITVCIPVRQQEATN